MFIIQTLNQISETGLSLFPSTDYRVSDNEKNPDAILCRSHNMHEITLPASLKVIARAGAGTNNIPVEKCTALGIPVLNTPGANANAVKELVIAGMLLACRNICQAWRYVQAIEGNDDELHKQVEKQKKQFAGFELPGKTLTVIGLGKIGVKVANAAYHLDMNVVGFDPAITVQNAWELSAAVKQADSLEDAIAQADFVTLHIPLTSKTKNLFDTVLLNKIKSDAVLLNFSRAGIVDDKALMHVLEKNHLSQYVCDFPSKHLQDNDKVICLPHLGASTKEAEENCAIMAVRQTMSYLTQGHIAHSVNFPSIKLTQTEGHRLIVINKNVPNMVAQISTVLSGANLNILDMINKSRGDIACTLLDVNDKISDRIIERLLKIKDVLSARRGA